MSHSDPTKETWIECKECGGQGWIECCPSGSPVMWPEQPMCSACGEWSIDECEVCKGKGEIEQ